MIEVVSAVIVQNRRVLLTQRGPGSFANTWEGPGGKVNPGETLTGALGREILEELGVACVVQSAPIAEYFADPPLVRQSLHGTFMPVRLVGKPRMLASIGMGWFGPAELRALADAGALTPGNAQCVEQIIAYMGGPARATYERMEIIDGDWTVVGFRLGALGRPGEWGIMVRHAAQANPAFARESWSPHVDGYPETFSRCPSEAVLLEHLASAKAMQESKV